MTCDHGPEDICRPVEVDGEIIRVHGGAEMTEEDRGHFAEIVRAAKARMEAEAANTPPRRFVLVHEACGHVMGYANERSTVFAAKMRLLVHGYKGWKVEERDATDAELMQLVDGERCGHCTVDGNLRTVLR